MISALGKQRQAGLGDFKVSLSLSPKQKQITFEMLISCSLGASSPSLFCFHGLNSLFSRTDPADSFPGNWKHPHGLSQLPTYTFLLVEVEFCLLLRVTSHQAVGTGHY